MTRSNENHRLGSGPTILIASCADHGTRSISASYEALMRPSDTFRFSKGFRRMGPRGWIEGGRFILGQTGGAVVCLFNAPILLGAVFRRTTGVRYSGILDWTESYPSQKRRRWTTAIYDTLYVRAFRRMDAVYSPSPGFRNYYNARGGDIRPCLYPLPIGLPRSVRTTVGSPVRILFVGADFRRKGGDMLLERWKQSRPSACSLTFVCPNPPVADLPGVNFRRDIQAGSSEQIRLFEEHDIFVLPTREEPFGFALLEALNAGMCCVTTVAAGAAQVVDEAGGIVAGSPEEAVGEAFRLASHPGEISMRRQACSGFLPVYTRRVEDSINEILGHRKQGSKQHA